MIRLACLLLCLSAGLASAQTLVVRSGEHGDFTRLVVRIPERATWSVSQSGRLARVTLSGVSARFDTSSVFSKIDRLRIADVSQARRSSPLEVKLACDCKVVASIEDVRYLVLDVRDGPIRDDSLAARFRLPISGQFELSGEKLSTTASGNPFVLGQSYLTTRLEPPVTLPLVPEGLSAVRKKPEQKHDNLELPTIQPEAPPRDVSLSEEILVRELARAASQGLLDPAITAPQVTVSQAKEDEPKPVAQVPEQDDVETPNSQIALTAVSAIDRELIDRLGLESLMQDSKKCIDDQELDIASWSDGRAFHLQIGDARADLYGEFDRIDTSSVIGLAQAYLYFGFGAEARHALALLDGDPSQVMHLKHMADILDGVENEKTVFFGLGHCDGRAALWSMLSNPRSGAASDVNTNAVLRTLWQLPPHLRSLLGPSLSRRFLNAGDNESASLILDSIERGATDESEETAIAEAELAVSLGNDDQANKVIDATARSDNARSVEALIIKVERAFDERSAPEPDVPALILSYLTEFKNGPDGSKLRRALALSHALLGDFAASERELQRIEAADGLAVADVVRSEVLWLVVERGSDLQLLELAMPAANGSGRPLDIALQTAIADRLLQLSLPDLAEVFLADDAPVFLDEKRRLMRAEASLSQGRPRQALLELLSLENSEASRLRATAHLMLDEHETAANYFAQAENDEAAERQMWLSNDWAALIEGDRQTEYAQAARDLASIGLLPSLADSEGPLDFGRSLLLKSEETRTQIGEIINMTETGTKMSMVTPSN